MSSGNSRWNSGSERGKRRSSRWRTSIIPTAAPADEINAISCGCMCQPDRHGCDGLLDACDGLPDVQKRSGDALWQVFLNVPLELLYQNGDGLGIAFFVVNDGSVHGPVNSGNRTCSQLLLQRSPFADQGETIPFHDQRQHFGGMGGTRTLFDSDSDVGQELQQSLVSVRVPLRVIENCEIAL